MLAGGGGAQIIYSAVGPAGQRRTPVRYHRDINDAACRLMRRTGSRRLRSIRIRRST